MTPNTPKIEPRTPEQQDQYDMCKKRQHQDNEPPAPTDFAALQAFMAKARSTTWKTCRWCGTEYQEVLEMRQVERAE